jgi:hypothetical protein
MGYSYQGRQLCCDVCGKVGGVRKVRCPFGYCQAVAICPACKKEHPEYVSKEGHRKMGCDVKHDEFMREQAKRADIIARGGLLRVAALSHGAMVKVIFKGRDGDYAYFMEPETYHAIPIDVPAELTDYRAHGKVWPSQNNDIYGAL